MVSGFWFAFFSEEGRKRIGNCVTEVIQGFLLERGGGKEVMAEGEVEKIVLWGHIRGYKCMLTY